MMLLEAYDSCRAKLHHPYPAGHDCPSEVANVFTPLGCPTEYSGPFHPINRGLAGSHEHNSCPRQPNPKVIKTASEAAMSMTLQRHWTQTPDNLSPAAAHQELLLLVHKWQRDELHCEQHHHLMQSRHVDQHVLQNQGDS